MQQDNKEQRRRRRKRPRAANLARARFSNCGESAYSSLLCATQLTLLASRPYAIKSKMIAGVLMTPNKII